MKNKRVKYLSLIALIFWIYIFINSVQPVTTLILAFISFCIAFIPILLYIKEENFNVLPLIQIHNLFYILSFSFIATQDIQRKFFLSESEINITLVYLIIGLILLNGSYYLLAPRLFNKIIKPIDLRKIKLSVEGLKFFGFFIWVLLEIIIFTKSIDISSLRFIISIIGGFSKAVILYLFFTKKLNTFDKILLAILFTLDLIYPISVGILAGTVTVIVFTGLLYVYAKRKIPYVFGISAIILFVLFQQVKLEFRQTIWFGQPQQFSLLDRTEILFNTSYNYFTSTKSSTKETTESAFSRLDHLGTTAYVISVSPSRIDYEYGSTYLPLFTKFVPRIIWPNKPEEKTPNEWAKKYGLLDPYNYQTAYNLPWFTEYYVNFGFWGIVLGMLLMGLLIRFLTIIFSNENNPMIFLMGIALTFYFYSPESNFSLMIGNLFLNFIVLTGYLYFINSLKRNLK